MYIYIRVGVRDREFESRYLLGLAAASRGHTVVIGNLRKVLRHADAIPPGWYHAKDLQPIPSKIELAHRLRNAGFVISSHDEESGLRSVSYDDFARIRFSEQMLSLASLVCCWGQHDYDSLCRIYPDSREIFSVTGSPRTDVWTLGSLPAGRIDLGPQRDASRPLIVVASSMRVMAPYPVWRLIEFEHHGPDIQCGNIIEHSNVEMLGSQVVEIGEILKLLVQLVKRFPAHQVVLRPHPVEDGHGWRRLVADVPGVEVVDQGSANQWIRDASAMIHFGSTTGIESMLAGTPTVAVDLHSDRDSNTFLRAGHPASTIVEAVDVLSGLLDGSTNPSASKSSQEMLNYRLRIPDHSLNVERIVDEWEERGAALPQTSTADDRTLARVLKDSTPRGSFTRKGELQIKLQRIRNRVASSRTLREVSDREPSQREIDGAAVNAGDRLLKATRFSPLIDPYVESIHSGITNRLGRYSEVSFDIVGPQLVLIMNRQRGDST